MKISCSVEVVNRSFPSLNISNRKSEHSHLSLGSTKDGILHLLLQTAKNGLGTKYIVKDNVETVFTKFLAEGKATIRLKKPPVDLAIKCETEKLKHFLRGLKLGLDGKSLSSICALPAKLSKVQAKPKTKIILTSMPPNFSVQELPGALEVLQLNFFNFTKFEGKFLRLQNLLLLNLNNNRLTSLPVNLDLLVNLKELHLASNELGKGNDWRWMKSTILQRNLTVLNLDLNKISCLPPVITQFKSLKILSLQGNELTALPNNIGLLQNLRNLHVNYNKISVYPCSMKFMEFDIVDITGNPNPDLALLPTSSPSENISLVNLAASVVLSLNLQLDESTLPGTLLRYLDKAGFCTCGKAVLPPYVSEYLFFRLRDVAKAIVFDVFSSVYIAVSHCQKCFVKRNVQ